MAAAARSKAEGGACSSKQQLQQRFEQQQPAAVIVFVTLFFFFVVLRSCSSSSAPTSSSSPPSWLSRDLQSRGASLRGRTVAAPQGDEVALQRALNLVHKNRDEYVVMLFYASWCPFSKLCRPNFNVLSSLFPTIGHFAFEESVIRPSILSRYGVHGFPTLFLLNSTMRVRYHGSRTINSLVAFYNDVTGVKPPSVGPFSVEKIADPSGSSKPAEFIEPESCPFSWASSPEKLLQQDTYLALATSFVLIKLLYLLLPQLNACVKRALRWHASLVGLWDNSQAYLVRAKQSFNRLNPCKRRAMNAKSLVSRALEGCTP